MKVEEARVVGKAAAAAAAAAASATAEGDGGGGGDGGGEGGRDGSRDGRTRAPKIGGEPVAGGGCESRRQGPELM